MMNRGVFLSFSFSFLFGGSALAQAELREDFVENPPHFPIVQEDLVQAEFLTLTRRGEGEERLKRSFHANKKNDPHYLWNGLCEAPGAVTFDFASSLDLSGEDSKVSLRTKNAGKSVIQIALKTVQGWIVADAMIGETADWTESSHHLSAQNWKTWDPETLEEGNVIAEVEFSDIRGVGFFFPMASAKSKDCIRLDWFSLSSSSMERKTAVEDSK